MGLTSHYYTPEEANRLLPEIRKIVSEIVEAKKELGWLQSGFKRNECMDELASLISKLEEKGIELKDMDAGLVDFPAKRFDQEVYLCWKLGEQQILYWHEIQTGYAGRKLLRPEPLKAR